MSNLSKSPLVTIIITNFNKSFFVLKALNSCLKQKYKKIEIIFFDDRSTDNSVKKVKEFKKKYNHGFKIILNSQKKNFSAPTNQLLAIKKSLNYAKGKYISLLDADDYFHKNKIYEIVKIFKENKTKIVLDQPIYKYKNRLTKKNFTNNLIKNKWPKFPPTSCMSFEKKTLKKTLKKIDYKKFPNLAIDFYLAVYYSIVLKNFYINDSHLTYYRQVKDGTDSKYLKFRSKQWWIRRKEAFDFLNQLLSKEKLGTNKSLDYVLTNLFNNLFDKN